MKSLKEYFAKKRKERHYLEARMSGLKIVDYEMFNHKERMESLNTTIILIFIYSIMIFIGFIYGASFIFNSMGV